MKKRKNSNRNLIYLLIIAALLLCSCGASGAGEENSASTSAAEETAASAQEAEQEEAASEQEEEASEQEEGASEQEEEASEQEEAEAEQEEEEATPEAEQAEAEPAAEPTPAQAFGDLKGWTTTKDGWIIIENGNTRTTVDMNNPGRITVPYEQFLSLEDVELLPVDTFYTIPMLSCSSPDSDGYVTYYIGYGITSGLHFSVPKKVLDDNNDDMYYISWQPMFLYDYGSGLRFPGRALFSDDRYENTISIEDNGTTYEITYSNEQNNTNNSGWDVKTSGNTAECSVKMSKEILWTIRAPKDYTGLVLAVDREVARDIWDPIAHSGGDVLDPTERVVWDADNVEDWYFLHFAFDENTGTIRIL